MEGAFAIFLGWLLFYYLLFISVVLGSRDSGAGLTLPYLPRHHLGVYVSKSLQIKHGCVREEFTVS